MRARTLIPSTLAAFSATSAASWKPSTWVAKITMFLAPMESAYSDAYEPRASSRPCARKIGSAALPPMLPGMRPPWTDGPSGESCSFQYSSM
jgi:hypothetical protein